MNKDYIYFLNTKMYTLCQLIPSLVSLRGIPTNCMHLERKLVCCYEPKNYNTIIRMIDIDRIFKEFEKDRGVKPDFISEIHIECYRDSNDFQIYKRAIIFLFYIREEDTFIKHRYWYNEDNYQDFETYFFEDYEKRLVEFQIERNNWDIKVRLEEIERFVKDNERLEKKLAIYK